MAKKRKRSNGEGSIYQNNGKWISQISYYKDGELTRPKRTSSKHADALIRLDELRKEASQLDMDSRHYTVETYLEKWLGRVENGKQSESTYLSYRNAIRKHIIPQIGRVKLQSLKPSKIHDMFDSLRTSGIGTRQIQTNYTVLNMALNQAYKEDVIIKNPCISVSRPVHESKEAIPFTEEERRAIFDQASGSFYHHLYKFMLATGVRSAEAYGLQWGDIDCKSKTIHIQRNYVRGEYGKLKSNHSNRYLDMTPGIEKALDLQRELIKTRGHTKNKHVFCAVQGGHIRSTKHSEKYWKPMLLKADVDVRGIHHLRHTFASELLANDADLIVVSKLLGHSSPVITLKYYAHFMPPKRSQVASKIEELFG